VEPEDLSGNFVVQAAGRAHRRYGGLECLGRTRGELPAHP
jgi:hypothetical protein